MYKKNVFSLETKIAKYGQKSCYEIQTKQGREFRSFEKIFINCAII